MSGPHPYNGSAWRNLPCRLAVGQAQQRKADQQECILRRPAAAQEPRRGHDKQADQYRHGAEHVAAAEPVSEDTEGYRKVLRWFEVGITTARGDPVVKVRKQI